MKNFHACDIRLAFDNKSLKKGYKRAFLKPFRPAPLMATGMLIEKLPYFDKPLPRNISGGGSLLRLRNIPEEIQKHLRGLRTG